MGKIILFFIFLGILSEVLKFINYKIALWRTEFPHLGEILFVIVLSYVLFTLYQHVKYVKERNKSVSNQALINEIKAIERKI